MRRPTKSSASNSAATRSCWGRCFVNTQLLLFLAYHLLSPNDITGLTPVAVPLVWITVGAWALVRTERPTGSQRQRTVGVAVAAGYFGVLGYFGGVWGPATEMLPAGIDLAVATAPPGWAPRLFVNLPANGLTVSSLQLPFQGVRINLIPWQVVGYVALAYLVYTAVLDAAGSAISGVVGLLSCVSCTWPVIATIATKRARQERGRRRRRLRPVVPPLDYRLRRHRRAAVLAPRLR